MTTMEYVFGAGGSMQETDETTHCVSYWHIPGGSNYANANVVVVFFDSEQGAEAFARQIGTYPPEMATVYPIEQHRKAVEAAERRRHAPDSIFENDMSPRF